jgi:hypothetical protein
VAGFGLCAIAGDAERHGVSGITRTGGCEGAGKEAGVLERQDVNGSICSSKEQPLRGLVFDSELRKNVQTKG